MVRQPLGDGISHPQYITRLSAGLQSPATLQYHPPKPNSTGTQQEGIQYGKCFTLSGKQPPDLLSTATTPPSLHPPIADKGHFVMLDLRSLDSTISKQIPFQIDSAASCNTLPSTHLTNIPCAKISPLKTVILPYASPPIKPIGHVTLTASKGRSTCDLTFHIINAEQPALLGIKASKTLGVLTFNADFIRKCSTSNRPQCLALIKIRLLAHPQPLQILQIGFGLSLEL